MPLHQSELGCWLWEDGEDWTLCPLCPKKGWGGFWVLLRVVRLQKKQSSKEVSFVFAVATSQKDKKLLRTFLYRKTLPAAASKVPIWALVLRYL